MQFVVFAEREEGNTPYHRQYDFFIQRFASLSLAANNDNNQKFKEYVNSDLLSCSALQINNYMCFA